MKKIKFFVWAILLIIGLLIFNFYISFGYGSFGGFLAEYRSLPKEEKLASLRNDAIENLTQAHAELDSVTGLTLHEKTYFDLCAKGEHGWKRSDDYANRCSYRLTYYYGTNREYKELLLDLEKTLSNSGWKIQVWGPPQPTISESVNEYSGEIFLAKLPVYENKAYGNSPMILAINGFNGYGVPWSKSNDEPDPFTTIVIQDVYKNESNKSPEEIFNKIISSGQNAIMIAISKDYFKN